MATDKQTAANRANAKKSTGPRTPEGKARSRANALTHGLTASVIVPGLEDPKELAECAGRYGLHYDPQGPVEEELVHQIVVAAHRMRRIQSMETEALLRGAFSAQRYEPEKFNSASDSGSLLYALNEESETILRLSALENRLQRQFLRCVTQLERLQTARRRETAAAEKMEKRTQSARGIIHLAPPSAPERNPLPPPSAPAPSPSPRNAPESSSVQEIRPSTGPKDPRRAS